MNNKILILGLGNSEHCDDGIGVHVINCLKERSQISNAEFIHGGMLNGDITDTIENTDCLIVVDMTEMDVAPGSIRVFEGIEMDAFITSHDESPHHETGLKNALSAALRDGRLPSHRALVGVQPKTFDGGNELTEEVARAVPYACCKVFEIAENWKI